MLRIYGVCLEMVRDVGGVAEEIEKVDRDLARQLRRASMSVVLNVAEGSGSRGGVRRARYRTALGSAEETRAAVDAAVAVGYVAEVGREVRDRLARIVGTLVRVSR